MSAFGLSRIFGSQFSLVGFTARVASKFEYFLIILSIIKSPADWLKQRESEKTLSVESTGRWRDWEGGEEDFRLEDVMIAGVEGVRGRRAMIGWGCAGGEESRADDERFPIQSFESFHPATQQLVWICRRTVSSGARIQNQWRCRWRCRTTGRLDERSAVRSDPGDDGTESERCCLKSHQ